MQITKITELDGKRHIALLDTFISIIAILHDIGAVEAQKKYGSIDGVYQEKDGPEVAKEILKKVRKCVWNVFEKETEIIKMISY